MLESNPGHYFRKLPLPQPFNFTLSALEHWGYSTFKKTEKVSGTYRLSKLSDPPSERIHGSQKFESTFLLLSWTFFLRRIISMKKNFKGPSYREYNFHMTAGWRLIPNWGALTFHLRDILSAIASLWKGVLAFKTLACIIAKILIASIASQAFKTNGLYYNQSTGWYDRKLNKQDSFTAKYFAILHKTL